MILDTRLTTSWWYGAHAILGIYAIHYQLEIKHDVLSSLENSLFITSRHKSFVIHRSTTYSVFFLLVNFKRIMLEHRHKATESHMNESNNTIYPLDIRMTRGSQPRKLSVSGNKTPQPPWHWPHRQWKPAWCNLSVIITASMGQWHPVVYCLRFTTDKHWRRNRGIAGLSPRWDFGSVTGYIAWYAYGF